MAINIKHKNASHVIIINGQAFKANDAGMWDLTDIWKTLQGIRDDVAKRAPVRWNQTTEGKRLSNSGKTATAKAGTENHTVANKQATLRYAGYVSAEFEDVVYDAFEAILELPEVALLVADKMRCVGYAHSAAILERHVFNDKCDWNALKGYKKSPKRHLSNSEREQQKWLRQAKAYEKNQSNPLT
ncbi:hypothetical protein [Pseudomonas migulae]|uniref:Uncharacterized protein n=1 Tax=Pseudomonas migulae TaxID=78543 RepID=A0ABY8MXE0_9PSED|nr:hypothetical protein [Pseudomonas migulae]WGK91261.1 hypothetical protein MOQ58_03465 [Pseudomonas migulae]